MSKIEEGKGYVVIVRNDRAILATAEFETRERAAAAAQMARLLGNEVTVTPIWYTTPADADAKLAALRARDAAYI